MSSTNLSPSKDAYETEGQPNVNNTQDKEKGQQLSETTSSLHYLSPLHSESLSLPSLMTSPLAAFPLSASHHDHVNKPCETHHYPFFSSCFLCLPTLAHNFFCSLALLPLVIIATAVASPSCPLRASSRVLFPTWTIPSLPLPEPGSPL